MPKIISLPKQLVSLPVKHIDRAGSILVVVLWSLSLLSVFALYLGYGVRQKIVLVGRLDTNAQLRFIAEAGVKQAVMIIKKEDDSGYYTLKGPQGSDVAAFKDIKLADGKFSIDILDEERKININKADMEIIKHLFQIVLDLDEMDAQNIAASIVDWRDADSELSTPLGSAEDRYYKGLSQPYESKDADFELLQEALLVNGVTEDIFDSIKDFITVYGDGKVNINTAPRQVLLALGIDEVIVDKIIYFRAGEDGIEATADDNIFKQQSGIVAILSQSYHLSASEVARLSNLVSTQKVSTDSNNFMVKSIAKLDNRQIETEVISIINRDGKILYWQGF